MSHVFWSVMQILNYVAGGRDVSTNITFMCQTIIRGLAAPLVKNLAYDVVHAAPLSDGDWSIVIEGLKSDIVGTFSLEVRLLSMLAHQISHIHLYHLEKAGLGLCTSCTTSVESQALPKRLMMCFRLCSAPTAEDLAMFDCLVSYAGASDGTSCSAEAASLQTQQCIAGGRAWDLPPALPPELLQGGGP